MEDLSQSKSSPVGIKEMEATRSCQNSSGRKSLGIALRCLVAFLLSSGCSTSTQELSELSLTFAEKSAGPRSTMPLLSFEGGGKELPRHCGPGFLRDAKPVDRERL